MKLPQWALLLIGAIVGAALVLVVQLFNASIKLPEGVGTVVASATAAVSAVLAWSGFTRWETRHRKERQAEIAGQALVLAVDFCVVLRRVAEQEDAFDGHGHAEIEDFEHYQKLLNDTALRQRFTTVRTQIEAYFPDGSSSPLESLRKLADEIDRQLEVAHHRCDEHGFLPKEHWDAVNAVFGAVMLARIDEALAEAKKRFRPFALVE